MRSPSVGPVPLWPSKLAAGNDSDAMRLTEPLLNPSRPQAASASELPAPRSPPESWQRVNSWPMPAQALREGLAVGGAVQEMPQRVFRDSLGEEGREGLQTLFDTSREGLQIMFANLHRKQRSPRMQEAVTALVRTLGLEDAIDLGAMEELTRSADEGEQSEQMDFTKFEATAQSLKLGALLRFGGLGSGSLSVMDFAPSRSDRRYVSSSRERESFIYGSRPGWAHNRWIHLCGLPAETAQTLKLLAVKYNLHTLALEDALGPSRLRSKVQTFEQHLFVSRRSSCSFHATLPSHPSGLTGRR